MLGWLMKRRSFLRGAGVVTIAIVGGGVWRAYNQGVFSTGQGPAYEPWKNRRQETNGSPLALVRAAILAASPHNTQPWLFKVSDSAIELHIADAWKAGRERTLADFVDALRSLPEDDTNTRLFLFTNEGEGKKIVEASSTANLELYSDAAVQAGSEPWVRSKWTEVQQYRDGLTVDAFGLPPMATAVAKMMTPGMLAWAASHRKRPSQR
jgi:hypothetical protein